MISMAHQISHHCRQSHRAKLLFGTNSCRSPRNALHRLKSLVQDLQKPIMTFALTTILSNLIDILSCTIIHICFLSIFTALRPYLVHADSESSRLCKRSRKVLIDEPVVNSKDS